MKQDTTTQLLDAAQDLIQHRSYNAFSYKDLATAVGIRTASIHYHFPAKADLGVAVMKRYLERLESATTEIAATESTSTGRLERFIQFYRDTEAAGAICLCGSLASDQESLPNALRGAVTSYLEFSERWVAERIAEGVTAGEFVFSGEASELAATLISGLQGGLILSRARSYQNPLLDTIERTFFRILNSA